LGDPLEELKRISASESAAVQDELADTEKAAAKAREKERRASEARVAAGRTPPGVFRSYRFFYLLLAGVMLGGIGTSAIFEDDWWDTQIVAGVAGAWTAVLIFFVIDSVTWKRLLPFKLEGFDSIAGDKDPGEGRVPFLAFDIHIRFIGEGNAQARAQTLEILASRVNRALKKDGELSEPTWRVVDGSSVRGEGSPMIYNGRFIEKWLRKEVRLLHRAFPVGAVTVNAKYTGASFEPSGD
jgi:hypothetical protein